MSNNHKPEVTTLDFNEAFPTLSRDDHEFGVSMSYDRGGCDWEFKVAEVTGHRDRDIIGVQVRMFDDAWAAYAQIPEFFAGLTALATDHDKVTLDDVKALCAHLGYRDRTAEYADRHEHQFRCACGAHPPTAARAPIREATTSSEENEA